MKKGLFTAFLTVFITAMVSAQTPTAVTAAFQHTNPGVNATFVQEGNVWAANFTQAGDQVSFKYTSEGSWVAKETEIQKAQIPAPALADINTRFGGFSFIKAAKREMPDGSLQYKYQYMDGSRYVDVYYTPNGQITGRNVF